MQTAQTPAPGSPPVNRSTRDAVNRFVSTLAGSFRSFYIYNQDNKAFDEIMQNVSKRFNDAVVDIKSIKLQITNRSLIFEAEPAGHKEITVFFASVLRNLGFREIIFTAPLQGRHFFQLLHILSGKEPVEAKNERLSSFIGDGDTKPITLVPVTANMLLLRLTDNQISQRLEPVTAADSDFMALLEQADPRTLPDLFTWICVRAERLAPFTANFVRNMVEATREGFFPIERFLALFPLPSRTKKRFEDGLSGPPPYRARKATPLFHRFLPSERPLKSGSLDWSSRLVAFSADEAQIHHALKSGGAVVSPTSDLELAQALMADGGSNLILGIHMLIRYMSEKNPVPVQERALKIAIDLWMSAKEEADNPSIVSLLSSLRQALSSFNNVNLVLFPLRNVTMESPMFSDTVAYFASLGKSAIPAIVGSLDAEQDRGMRKKLCAVITAVAKENGVDSLVAAMKGASPFLLRNIVMILGDIRDAQAVAELAPLLTHGQKIVRTEAMRTLCKIGTPEANAALYSNMARIPDIDNRQIVVDYLVQKRHPRILDQLLMFAKDSASAGPWRRAVYTGIANFGGAQARTFLESVQKEGGFLGRLAGDQREDLAHIKTLLGRMKT